MDLLRLEILSTLSETLPSDLQNKIISLDLYAMGSVSIAEPILFIWSIISTPIY
jgi:hypothetical protein